MTLEGTHPRDWRAASTGELCQSIVPGRNKPKVWGGSIPWIRTHELGDSLYLHSEDVELRIDEKELRKCGGKIAPTSSVVMTCVGDVGISCVLAEPASMNQQLHAFVCGKDILPEFLAYAIQGRKKHIETLATQTTVSYLNKNACESIRIYVPSLAEQKRIVDVILSAERSVLETRKVEELHAKLKRSLMQRLLARGIGHTKFKKTKIGDIPESWEIRALGELSKINARRLNDKTDSESEIEYIEIASIEDPGYIGHTSRMRYSEAPSRARRIVRKGDVIVSTVRPYLKAIALIRQDSDDLVASTGFAVLTPSKNIDSEFLLQSVFSESFMAYLSRRMVGSNYPAVTAKDIEQYQLACPPEKEQRRIANILCIVDEKKETERKYCTELECLKKGLMQVLLTGTVRVKI